MNKAARAKPSVDHKKGAQVIQLNNVIIFKLIIGLRKYDEITTKTVGMSDGIVFGNVRRGSVEVAVEVASKKVLNFVPARASAMCVIAERKRMFFCFEPLIEW